MFDCYDVVNGTGYARNSFGIGINNNMQHYGTTTAFPPDFVSCSL